MNRIILALLLLFVSMPYMSASSYKAHDNQYPTGIAEGAKLIPVVSYTTDGFTDDICKSFRFRDDRECYFYNSEKVSDRFSYYNPVLIRNGNKYSALVDMVLSNLLNNTIALKDSVFIFTLPQGENIKLRRTEYLGYIDKGDVYVVLESDILPLADFISNGNNSGYITFGANFSHISSRPLESLPDEKEAEDILSNNYYFTLLDRKDNNLAYNQLMQCLSGSIVCNDKQSQCIRAIIDAASKETDKLLFHFQANAYHNITKIDCCKTDYNNNFSEAEQKLIDKALKEEYERMQNAKLFFMHKLGNTDENGVYITEEDVFDVISANVKKYMSSIN